MEERNLVIYSGFGAKGPGDGVKWLNELIGTKQKVEGKQYIVLELLHFQYLPLAMDKWHIVALVRGRTM